RATSPSPLYPLSLHDALPIYSSAGAAVRFIVHADALPGVVLDDHFVAEVNGFAHASRRQSDAVLQYLDFLGHTDAHVALPSRDKDRKSTRLNSCHVSISYAVF